MINSIEFLDNSNVYSGHISSKAILDRDIFSVKMYDSYQKFFRCYDFNTIDIKNAFTQAKCDPNIFGYEVYDRYVGNCKIVIRALIDNDLMYVKIISNDIDRPPFIMELVDAKVMEYFLNSI